MKCEKIKKIIDLSLVSGSIDLDSDIRVHIDSCESCRAYYDETLSLQADLSNQKFKVNPGELDGITFENITELADVSETEVTGTRARRSFKWLWAPAAVAAILFIVFIAPNIVPNGDIEIVTYTNDLVLDNDVDLVLSDGLGSELISQLIEDENDLELLSEELAFDIELNTLLESLTDDELEALDKILNEYDRSSG